jgi:hypothetical protein
MYFEERYAIKTLSEIALSEAKTMNTINNVEYIKLSLTKNNWGEKDFINTR